MERMTHLNEENVQRWRAHCQKYYPLYEEPCPGSNLKPYDDVRWLDWADMRVIWGHDQPRDVNCYCPDIFGETSVTINSDWITDRAPVNEEEPPLPIWPEELTMMRATAVEQQSTPTAQKGAKRERTLADEKAQVRAALESIPQELRKAARAKIRAMRKDLVDEHD